MIELSIQNFLTTIIIKQFAVHFSALIKLCSSLFSIYLYSLSSYRLIVPTLDFEINYFHFMRDWAKLMQKNIDRSVASHNIDTRQFDKKT